MKTKILRGTGKDLLSRLKIAYGNQFGTDQSNNKATSKTYWEFIKNPSEKFPYTIDNLLGVIDHEVIPSDEDLFKLIEANNTLRQLLQELLFSPDKFNLLLTDELKFSKEEGETITKKVLETRDKAIKKLQILFINNGIFFQKVFANCPTFISSLSTENLKTLVMNNYQAALLLSTSKYAEKIAKSLNKAEVYDILTKDLNGHSELLKFVAMFEYLMQYNKILLMKVMGEVVEQLNKDDLSPEQKKIVDLFYNPKPMPKLASILESDPELFLLMCEPEGETIFKVLRLSTKPLNFLYSMVKKNNEIAELIADNLVPVLTSIYNSDINVDDKKLADFLESKKVKVNNKNKSYSEILAEQVAAMLNNLFKKQEEYIAETQDLITLFEKSYIRKWVKISEQEIGNMLHSTYRSFFDRIICDDEKLWKIFGEYHTNNKRNGNENVANIVAAYPKFIQAKFNLQLNFNKLINGEVDVVDDHSAYLMVNSTKHWDILKKKLPPKEFEGETTKNVLFYIKRQYEQNKKQSSDFDEYVVDYFIHRSSLMIEGQIKLFFSLADGEKMLKWLTKQNKRFSQRMGSFRQKYVNESEIRESFNGVDDVCSLGLTILNQDHYFSDKLIDQLSACNINAFARFLNVLDELADLSSKMLSHLVLNTEIDLDKTILKETFVNKPELFLGIFKDNEPQILKELASSPYFLELLSEKAIYSKLEPAHCELLLNTDNSEINAFLKDTFLRRPNLLQGLLELKKKPVASPKDSENLISILEQAKWLDRLKLEEIINLKGLEHPSLTQIIKKNIVKIALYGKEDSYTAYIHEFFGNNVGAVFLIDLIDQATDEELKEIWHKSHFIQNHLANSNYIEAIDNKKILKLMKLTAPELNEDTLNFIKRYPKIFLRLIKDPDIYSELDSIPNELKVLAESEECKPLISFVNLPLDDFLKLLKLQQKELPLILVNFIATYIKNKKDFQPIAELIPAKECDDVVLSLFENTLVGLLNNEEFVGGFLCEDNYNREQVIKKLISDKQEVLQGAVESAANNFHIFAKRLLTLASFQISNPEIYKFVYHHPKTFYNLLNFVKELEDERSKSFTFDELKLLMSINDKQIQLSIFNNQYFSRTWEIRNQFTKQDVPIILELLMANEAQWYMTDKRYEKILALLKSYIKELFYTQEDKELILLLPLIKNKNCLELFSTLESDHLNKLIEIGGDEVVDVIFSPEFSSTEQRALLFERFAAKCLTTVVNKKLIEKCFEDKRVHKLFQDLTPESGLPTFLANSVMVASPGLVERLFQPEYNIDFETFFDKANQSLITISTFDLFKHNKFFAKEVIHRPNLLKVSNFYNNEDLAQMLLNKEFAETIRFLLDNSSALFLKVLKNCYDFMPEEIKKQLTYLLPREILEEAPILTESWVFVEEDNNNVAASRTDEKYYPKEAGEKNFQKKIQSAKGAEKYNRSQALEIYLNAASIECDNQERLYHFLGIKGKQALKLKILHLSLALKNANALQLLIEFLKNYQGKMSVNLLPIQVLYIEDVFTACKQQTNSNPNLMFDYLTSLNNLDPVVLMDQIDKLKLDLHPHTIVTCVEALLKLLLKSYATVQSLESTSKFLLILSNVVRFYNFEFLDFINQEPVLKEKIFTLLSSEELNKYFSVVEEAKLKCYVLKAMLSDFQKNISTQKITETKLLGEKISLIRKTVIDEVLKEKELHLTPLELITLADSNLILYFLRNEQYTQDLSSKDLMDLATHIKQPHRCYFVYPHLFTKLTIKDFDQLANMAGFKNLETMQKSSSPSPLFAAFILQLSTKKELAPVAKIMPTKIEPEKTEVKPLPEEKVFPTEEKEASSLGVSTKVMLKAMQDKNPPQVDNAPQNGNEGGRKQLLKDIVKGKQLKRVEKDMVLGFSNDFIREISKNLIPSSVKPGDFVEQLKELVSNDTKSVQEIKEKLEKLTSCIQPDFKAKFTSEFNAENIWKKQTERKIQDSESIEKIFQSVAAHMIDRRKHSNEDESDEESKNEETNNAEWEEKESNNNFNL